MEVEEESVKNKNATKLAFILTDNGFGTPKSNFVISALKPNGKEYTAKMYINKSRLPEISNIIEDNSVFAMDFDYFDYLYNCVKKNFIDVVQEDK